jgi:hypothetical protein
MHNYAYFRSSLSDIPKTLYDSINIGIMKKCNTNLNLSDRSTRNALGRVDNAMVEFHMTYLHIDFITRRLKSHGTPFLRKTCAMIDSKEGNVKFQFTQEFVGALSKKGGIKEKMLP